MREASFENFELCAAAEVSVTVTLNIAVRQSGDASALRKQSAPSGMSAAGYYADFRAEHRLGFDIVELKKLLEGAGVDFLEYVKGDTMKLKKLAKRDRELMGKLDELAVDKPVSKFALFKGDDEEEEGDED
mgnify:CR=1 FL=1